MSTPAKSRRFSKRRRGFAQSPPRTSPIVINNHQEDKAAIEICFDQNITLLISLSPNIPAGQVIMEGSNLIDNSNIDKKSCLYEPRLNAFEDPNPASHSFSPDSLEAQRKIIIEFLYETNGAIVSESSCGDDMWLFFVHSERDSYKFGQRVWHTSGASCWDPTKSMRTVAEKPPELNGWKGLYSGKTRTNFFDGNKNWW